MLIWDLPLLAPILQAWFMLDTSCVPQKWHSIFWSQLGNMFNPSIHLGPNYRNHSGPQGHRYFGVIEYKTKHQVFFVDDVDFLEGTNHCQHNSFCWFVVCFGFKYWNRHVFDMYPPKQMTRDMWCRCLSFDFVDYYVCIRFAWNRTIKLHRELWLLMVNVLVGFLWFFVLAVDSASFEHRWNWC